MNLHCLKHHNTTFSDPTGDFFGFSSSLSFAQFPGSELNAIFSARLITENSVQKYWITGNRFDIVLDFKRNFPHSILQTNIHNE